MKILDIFLTASTNMFRSKLRTSLTILAIFIGAFTLTITSGIGSGISGYINKQLGNLGAKDVLLVTAVNPSTGPSTGSTAPKKYDPNRKSVASGGPGGAQPILTDADITKIKAHAGVLSVRPTRTVAASYIQGLSVDKYQVTVAPNIRGTNLDLAAGTNVEDSSSQYQVILPVSYISSLGFSDAKAAVGKSVTIGISDAFGKVQEQKAVVVGVQQKGLLGGSNVTVNNPLTQQLYALQTQGLPPATTQQYQQVEAKIDAKLSAATITSLKATLKDQGYTAQTVQDQIGSFKTVISGVIYVLDAFAVIALLAASFGIINTLLMAVQERTKEIGLMKSMGMGGGRIFLLFSMEAVMIGFWGSLLGVGVAYGVGQAANHILSNGFLKDLPGLNIVAFPLQSIGIIMLIIMAIAFLAGTLPARRASRLNPIDALRYE